MSKKKPFAVRPDRTRFRTRSYVQPFIGRYRNKLFNTSTGVVTYDYDTPRTFLVSQKEEMVDSISPGYERIVSLGGICAHPMSMVKQQYSAADSGFALRITSGTSQQDYSEDAFFPHLSGKLNHVPHGINVENLINLAQTKCLSNVRTSSFMGIVAAAELSKTMRMIISPLSAVAPLLSYVSQLRRGNVNLAIQNRGRTLTVNGRKFTRPGYQGYKGPGRLIKPPSGNIVVPSGSAISGAVLANNLGLRPLMMDLNALLKEIPKAHTSERLTFRAKVADKSTKSATSTGGGPWGVVTTTSTTETEVSVRCTALVEDKFSPAADFGVSLDDIPEAAWELIPYSFVVDYFVNVGDVLGAARALRQYNFLCFSTVVTTGLDTKRIVTGHVPTAPYVAIRSLSGGDQLTGTEKTRTIGVPTPTFAYSPLSQSMRPTVVQNLLSLTVQQLTGLNSGRKRTFY